MKVIAACLVVSGMVMSGVTACSDAVSDPVSPTQAAPLVGAWRTKLQFSSGALADLHDLEFMYSFNQGGTLTQSSNYDGTPPVPPAYGLWRQTGPRTFELKYASYSPPKFVKSGKSSGWVPTGRALYTEKIELSEDGRSYSAKVIYDCVSPTGAPVAGGGEGEAHGTRTTFDAP